MLTGKMMFANPMQMQVLLEAEGVRVVDDRVVEFGRLFWEPSNELALGDKEKGR